MDTTAVNIQPEAVAGLFGVSPLWLATSASVAVMAVNTIKQLAPKVVGGGTVVLPALGFLASGVYSVLTLHGAQPVIAGTLSTFLTGWGTWFLAKKVATAAGMRDA